MTDEDLITRIKFIVDRLSFRIGDLTLMYEHKQVDPDDFYEEVITQRVTLSKVS